MGEKDEKIRGGKIFVVLCVAVLIVSVATLCANLSACMQVNSEEGYVFEYNSVAFAVGDDAETVLSRLGEAKSCKENSDGCGGGDIIKTFEYDGFSLEVKCVSDKEIISKIMLKNDSVKTSEGIFIGSLQSDVIETYGEEYEENYNGIIYTKQNTRLNFVIKNGVVKSLYYDCTTD